MDSESPIALDFSQSMTHTYDFGAGSGAALDELAFTPQDLNQESGSDLVNATQIFHQRQNSSMTGVDTATEDTPIRPRQDSTSIAKSGSAHDDTPTWSELKTKAGKERKRLPLACIACRRKKIKCSGEKPACKHCLKARVPCVYKVTTRKAAPRTDYMAMLDKRLKRMEDRVIKIIPKEELPDTSQRSSVRPPIPGTAKSNETLENKENQNKRSMEEAFDKELVDWSKPRTGSSQLDTAARVRPQRETENKLFSEGAEALPPQHIQEHLAEVFFDCVYGQSYLLLHKPSFMRKLKAGKVPPVLILAVCAISARFSTHPQVSTEPAFLRGEQYATPARVIVEKRHFEPNITILTCMIILGLHYFGTCEGGLSWSFGGQAMRMGYALQLHKELDRDPLGLAHAERVAASGKQPPRINELSFTDREIRRRTMWACFLMDTFNSSGSERPSFLNEDYMFIQLPIKETNFQLEVPGLTEDLRGHIPLDSNRSSLKDQEAAAKANMGVEAYVIRSVVIWKRIVKYLNLGGRDKDAHPIWDPLSDFANLQRQVANLSSTLPKSLQYTKENVQQHAAERCANQFIFLHIVIAQCTLFLHRFAIPTAPNTHRSYPPATPKSFLATAATTVLDAASRISHLLADSTGHTLTVPFAGYCAYTSATVHIWGIFSKNIVLENVSRECLRHNYKYINRMKRYWGMFHYMAESVKDTYRAFSDAAARSQKRSERADNKDDSKLTATESGAAAAELNSRAASPSIDALDGPGSTKRPDASKNKVFQYGDWFNKYPHGVSEQEWEQNRLPHRAETHKGTEAVMSQQAELQSVEEFFASLSPPSKEDGPNRKKVARKRGKSVAEEKKKTIAANTSTNTGTSIGTGAGTNTAVGSGAGSGSSAGASTGRKQMENAKLSSHSLYPLSDTTFPSEMSLSGLDVPMSGVTGLQSGSGTSAFDLTSPTTYGFAVTQGQSPFEYQSPSGSSATGTHNPAGTGHTNFNFTYTSAVPQLDRQMVFNGYTGLDQGTSQSSGNNLDFWASPWNGSGDVDVDGMTGFNDPSFGLNATGNITGAEANVAGRNQASGTQGGSTSTAWIMPFNIEPPNASNFPPADSMQGFDDFGGFDPMVDVTPFSFSPVAEQNE